jgi:hypothetical protein
VGLFSKENNTPLRDAAFGFTVDGSVTSADTYPQYNKSANLVKGLTLCAACLDIRTMGAYSKYNKIYHAFIF